MARDIEFTVPSIDQGPRAARDRIAPLRPVVGWAMYLDLELLVSELVANAVRYAGAGNRSPIDVRIRADRAFVRAEVRDRGAGFEPPRQPLPRDDHRGGFGLFLLAELSTRWGAERTAEGMRVWFELRAPNVPHRAAGGATWIRPDDGPKARRREHRSPRPRGASRCSSVSG
jgi:two-component sensor histidine kinase